MKMTRREFLKLSAATGVSASVMNIYDYVNPDPALAESTSPEEVKYTHCVQCNHGPRCGMKCIVKDNKVVRIERRDNYPNVNICAKGVSAVQEMYDPARLLHPMKRTNPKGEPGQWEQITWDEALATIAEKLNGIKEKYGAEKVLFSTGDPKEPRSAVQRLAFTFGSPNMGTESSTCYKATELSQKLIYGPEWFTAKSFATGGNPTLGKSRCCIIWGNNPAWSGPAGWKGLLTNKESGNKFIVVDPRKTPTAECIADVHLQIRPGTDGALALAFGNAIIESGNYDKEFVEKWCHGFEEYKEYVKQFTLEKAAEICQIPMDKLQAAVKLLTEGTGPVIHKSAAAFPHHTNGINNYRAMSLLLPLTGGVDAPGGCSIADEPLCFDEWQMTFDFARSSDLLPQLDHLRVDRPYFPVWADTDQQGSVQLNRIPEYVETGAIKAAVMFGQNAMMWPQTKQYQEAFKNMEFCVCADFYNNKWTHDYVDMLLPAAMSFERSCPITVFGRRIFLREPIVTPQGEARPDYRIACDIGVALGYKDEFWGGGEESEINCIKESLRTLNSPTPITYEELKAAGKDGITIPMKGEKQIKKYELGLLRPDGQPGFTSPTGKVEFVSETLKKYGFDGLPVWNEPVNSPVATPEVAKDYPLILNTGNRVPMFTHSKQRHVQWLRALMPDPIVRMYPTDAEERGIAEGDWVYITTQLGEIKARAELTKMVKPGCMDMFHGWSEANVNELVSRDFDPISGFPPYKEGLCQIRKAEA